MYKKLFWALLIIAYVLLGLFGFLSGMLSEGLIGSTHPMADLLADAMVWLGLLISLSAVACPLAALGLKRRPVFRGMVLVIPFLLLAVQLVLSAAAEKLC